MTLERWQQVTELYHAAQARAPHERAAFLHAHCAGDEALQHEVNSLLAADERAGDYLATPALELEAKARVSEQQAAFAIRQFSHYEIQSLLGVGSMGEVYLAQDTSLERPVAIKILPQRFTADAARLHRFTREAKAASALNHPNIITIHEIGQVTTEAGELHFIATELIKGVTLRQRLDTSGQLPWREALDVASQIAAALGAAHCAGIVHRDIKPENVMVRPDGLVKVLDFGLAKLTAPASGQLVDAETGAPAPVIAGQTQPGMILGTLRYMSPEQARGRTVDAQTDIFSLGAVLYELLTGQPLFAGETSADVIAAVIHTELPPLREALPDAPPELEGILRQALAKEVTQRYSTAHALHDDLQTLRQESELRARLVDSGRVLTTSFAAPVARLSFARVGWWRVALLVAVAGSVWWLAGRRGERVKAPAPEALKTVEVANWASTPGEVYSVGAFSPDGKWVAFTSTKSGNKNIWVKQAAAGDAEPSTRDEFGNENPIWSPAGDEIAFLTQRNGQHGIWRKPPLGGNAVLLKPFAPNETKTVLRYWSKKGLLYYEAQGNLFALAVNNGQTRQVSNFEVANTTVSQFNISPDEEWISYVSQTEDKRYAVWALPARGGRARQVARFPEEIQNTLWHPDNNRIFCSVNLAGVFQVFVTDIAARQPVQLTFGETDSLALDVSADGTRILYGSSKEESDVWGVDKATRREFVVAADISAELWPAVSPDSRTLAYQAVRNLSQGNKLASADILIKALNPAAQPVTLAQNGNVVRWSPDGTRLAFIRRLNGTFNLWAVPVNGGVEQQLTTNGIVTVGNSVLPYNLVQNSFWAWSPDGRRLVYLARKQGRQSFWLVAADGTGHTPVNLPDDPNLLIECPLWSLDSKRLAWSSRTIALGTNGKRLYGIWITDLETKTSKQLYQADSFLRLIGWSPLDESLLFATFVGKASYTQPTTVGVHRVAVKTAVKTDITVLLYAYFSNLHLSADRRTLAFAARQAGLDNLWVMPAHGGTSTKLTANSDPHLYFSTLAWAPNGQALYFGKQSRYSLLSMLTGFE